MQKNQKKIFCIGFNKTGTTTIKKCFEILKLGTIAPTTSKTIRPINHEIFNNDNYEPALKVAERYTCFEDRPWNIWEMYRRLDDHFPDSRFILTIRNSETWWQSVERWISITKPWMASRYRVHLRATDLRKESMIAAYENYNHEVLSYFQATDKLLVINLEDGLEWKPFCDFFYKPIPQVPFPHANKQSYDRKDIAKAVKTFQKKILGKGKLRDYIYSFMSKLIKKNTKCYYCDNRAIYYHPSVTRYKRVLDVVLKDIASIRRDKSKNNISPPLIPLHKDYSYDTDDMAIVCCYINLNDSPLKKKSYDHFYRNIKKTGLKLLTIELMFPGQNSDFVNRYQDVITIDSPENLWSKEYLLNIGINKLLDEGYKKIVWLEPCIIVKDTMKWMTKIAGALENNVYAQVFNSLNISDKTKGFDYGGAARADLLKNVKLYDRALFSRGAMMIYIASFGYSDKWFKSISKITHHYFCCCAMCRKRVPAPFYTWHYLTWAQEWAKYVNGKVGYVDQQFTLLHNDYNSDFENSAFLALLGHAYDPVNDIVINKDKTLKWSPKKKKLKEKMDNLINTYFP